MSLKLSDCQQLALKHVLDKNEALLLMGCGLGKTAVCLRAVEELLVDDRTKGVLVVAPLRVCKITWPHEAIKWKEFRWLKVANLRTDEGIAALYDGLAHIYVINYEMLPWLQRIYLKGRKPYDYAFDSVIWDEISLAKNHKSARVNKVRTFFRENLKRHWGLTGTPTPNSLIDLFAEVRLIDGGTRLGEFITTFRYTYCGFTKSKYVTWFVREGYEQKIYDKIKDITLVLKTEDWSDLPEIEEIDIYVTLPKEARRVYEETEEDLISIIKAGKILEAVNRGVLVTKLLQICSGSVYYENDETGERKVSKLHDAKLQAFNKLKLDGNSLVAYNFRHELDQLKNYCKVFSLYPSEKVVCDLWNVGKIKKLAAHPLQISHGLNLQAGGSNVIWFSPTYNREHYEQLYRRLARRGQNKRVKVYRIIAKDTIDEVVLEALTDKKNNQEALLSALKTYAKTK